MFVCGQDKGHFLGGSLSSSVFFQQFSLEDLRLLKSQLYSSLCTPPTNGFLGCGGWGGALGYLLGLSALEGHCRPSRRDDHRAPFKSGKTRPINQSRGRRGREAAGMEVGQRPSICQGDICLSSSLVPPNSSPARGFLSFLLIVVVSSSSSSFHPRLSSARRLSLNKSEPPFFFFASSVCTSRCNLRSVPCASLCLLIFFVSLCALACDCVCAQFGSSSPPLLLPISLFSFHAFSLTSSLFQHPSNPPHRLSSTSLRPPNPPRPHPLPPTLCLELLVVLRTLAPSPSAAICFGLSALQPAAGWDKALMYFAFQCGASVNWMAIFLIGEKKKVLGLVTLTQLGAKHTFKKLIGRLGNLCQLSVFFYELKCII